MSNPLSSHTSTQKWAGVPPADVDKEPSRRRHSSDTLPPPTGIQGKESRGREVNSTLYSHDTSQHGVIASAQSAIHNASETIKHYLPESVSSHLPGSSPESTPQSDPKGSSGGVLRGTAGSPEQSVPQSLPTKLPSEMGFKDSPLPSKEIPGGSRVGVGSLPGRLSEISVAKLPEERRQENLPSHETDHEQLGKTGGVGPLPGGPNESGVALLPEERAHPVGEIQPAKDVPSSSPAGVGSVLVPGKSSATSAKKAPEELRREVLSSQAGRQAQLGMPGESALEHRVVRDEVTDEPKSTASGELRPPSDHEHERDTSPAFPPGLGKSQTDVEKREEDLLNGKEAAQDSERPVREKQRSKSGDELASREKSQDTTDVHVKATTSSPDVPENSVSEHSVPAPPHTSPVMSSRRHRASTGSTPQKVGFMDKMKGEAMVLSGKLGHNEKKVEEGKSLMGK